MREGSSHSFFHSPRCIKGGSAAHQDLRERFSAPASLDLHESHSHSSIRAKFRRTSHFTLGILPSGGTSLNIRPPLVVSAERARSTPASFRTPYGTTWMHRDIPYPAYHPGSPPEIRNPRDCH
uniref:(northern house mosquito) hypothetical protein n=1 Tax=Culex pipiens TaxID=7175 RepID=A0A8D8BMT1_CULPI